MQAMQRDSCPGDEVRATTDEGSMEAYRNRIIQSDVLEGLKQLPNDYVQTVVTSPPYFGLRDYGVAGQIGLEETPEEYIEKLVAVFREVRRVLRPDGTCWINIGDSYAGGRIGRDDSGDNGAFRGPRIESKCRDVPAGYKPKDLMMIPARVAIALQADGWWLRSDIIWHKPTAMPESVTDRPTNAHEHIFLLAKSERYFYNADAIREPLRPKTFTTFGTTRTAGGDSSGLVKSANLGAMLRKPRLDPDGNVSGANKRSVWTVASYAYAESHFATFPPKLIEPMILAGTSPRACEHCGAPWERVIEPTGHINKREPAHAPFSSPTKIDSTGWAPTHQATDQWQPTCTCINGGHGRCIVLDPFIGSGTTALVAIQHARHWIGIELNPDYVDLARKRIAVVQVNMWESEVAV
jgi:DNA modification methylase